MSTAETPPPAGGENNEQRTGVWLSSVEHKGDVMHKVRDLGFCPFSESEWWPNHPFQCFVEM